MYPNDSYEAHPMVKLSYMLYVNMMGTGIYLCVEECVVQCVSRQYGWITVDLVNGQLHSWNSSTAHKITSKGHHQSNVERTGSISTSCRIWHTALVVSGDVYIGIDLLVRSKVLSSSYEYYLCKQEDPAKPENHHLRRLRTHFRKSLMRPTHPLQGPAIGSSGSQFPLPRAWE